MRKKEAILKHDTQTPKTQVPSINVRSPRKADPTSEKKRTKPEPLKAFEGSEQILSMSDRQQVLMLEIKQLKRENNFLKRKISQLNAQIGIKNGPRRPKQTQKRTASFLSLESMPLSVNVVFEQINNIMNTIVSLFKIDFTQKELSQFSKKCQEDLAGQCPIKKHIVFKKFYLNQKLERILLEKQQERFPLLLNLFTEYYSSKQANDQKVIKSIDNLTLKAHQLNELIIQKVQEKRKERGTLSTIKQEEDMPLSTLKAPTPTKNFIAQNKMMTHSPTSNRGAKKGSRMPTSPNEKRRQPEF